MDLEERFRTVLPMLTRQIEALNLLQKSRRLGPAAAAKVAAAPLGSVLEPSGTRSRFLSTQVLTGQKGGAVLSQRFRRDGNDEDEDDEDTAVLEKKVHGANMPEAALKVCLKELKRSV